MLYLLKQKKMAQTGLKEMTNKKQNYTEATPEQIKEWQEGDRTWWAERALHFVAIASLVQVVMLGFMMLSFFVIQLGVQGVQ